MCAINCPFVQLNVQRFTDTSHLDHPAHNPLSYSAESAVLSRASQTKGIWLLH